MEDNLWLPGQASALKRLLAALGVGDEERPDWQADFDESRGRMLTKPVWVNRAMRRAQGQRGRGAHGGMAPTLPKTPGLDRRYRLERRAPDGSPLEVDMKGWIHKS